MFIHYIFSTEHRTMQNILIIIFYWRISLKNLKLQVNKLHIIFIQSPIIQIIEANLNV